MRYRGVVNKAFQNVAEKGFDWGDLHPVLPPWGSVVKWDEANRSVEHLIGLHRPELEQTFFLARNIQGQLESIFPLIDDLCASTCPWCPDPCCMIAKVWIDFQDLLFLHLSGQVIPQAQLLQELGNTCRYWSHRGCTLTRIVRPWICTWYSCPPQMANFRKQHPVVQETFNHAVQAIKTARNQMEAEFIRVVA